MTEDTKIILERLEKMDSKIDQLDSRMDMLDSRVDTLDFRVNEVKSQVTCIQLILENEIRRNIQIVAEGHLDLSRKLDDAVKVKEERELLLVRTNVLESDVKTLKGQVNALSSVS